MHLVSPAGLVHYWALHLPLGVADGLVSEAICDLFVAQLGALGAPDRRFLAHHGRCFGPAEIYLLALGHGVLHVLIHILDVHRHGVDSAVRSQPRALAGEFSVVLGEIAGDLVVEGRCRSLIRPGPVEGRL